MTDYEKEIIRASSAIVQGIVANSSVKVKYREEPDGRITIWYAAEGSNKELNMASFFDSVYWSLKAVDIEGKA